MLENRESPRFEPNFFLQIFEVKSNVLVGTVVNISKTGLLLLCRKALEEERVYQLWLEVPSNYTKTEHIMFEAKCVWLKQFDNHEQTHCGMLLMNLSTKSILFFDELINYISARYNLPEKNKLPKTG